MTDQTEELVKAALQDADIGVVYTLHGERKVRYNKGKHEHLPYEVVLLDPVPRKFKVPHHEIMEVIYSAVNDIAQMNRSIPLTRNELIKPFSKRGITTDGISKKLIYDLVDFGLIQERIIKIVNVAGKPVRAQAVIYFTPQGRAYVREKIDADYKP